MQNMKKNLPKRFTMFFMKFNEILTRYREHSGMSKTELAKAIDKKIFF